VVKGLDRERRGYRASGIAWEIGSVWRIQVFKIKRRNGRIS
jgi:hypothetical protein